jgi:plasmid maintenance system antidote protein VapI
MIHNDREYSEAIERLKAEKNRLAEQERVLVEMGLGTVEVKRALDPARSFHAQLREEVEDYEGLCRGEFQELHNLSGLGHLLVRARIARRVSQRALAARLEVDPSQVSRDERNEYRGITLERAIKVLDALGVKLVTRVKLDEERPAA